MIQVTELWIYPIKSCRGIAAEALELDDRGPRHDRRWMLVDDDGRFVSQREAPRMTLIDVALAADALHVSAPGMSTLSVPASASGSTEPCTIWQDTLPLARVSADADVWFSRFLGMRVRLMYMPDATERVVNRTYSPATRLVSLADGYPLMMIGEGSLALLNEKLTARGEPSVPMQRFRPNIVVAGVAAHEEDTWTSIRIGDVACNVVKPCERCTITTVEISTGQAGKEPLRTLAEYRKHGSKIYFGQNVIHAAAGTIRRADAVNPSASS